MICSECKIDKIVKDFIKSENICFKCLYRLKLEKTRKNGTSKAALCRTCGNEVVIKKDVKKRQRTIFCSCECAEVGHREQINNHWTRKVHVDND